jgi:hypothetical protein
MADLRPGAAFHHVIPILDHEEIGDKKVPIEIGLQGRMPQPAEQTTREERAAETDSMPFDVLKVHPEELAVCLLISFLTSRNSSPCWTLRSSSR